MFLIDAIYINNSGGLILLQYLLNELSQRQENYELLLDKRIEKLELADPTKCIYVSGSERERINFYKANRCYYHKVLCFGNVPPPIRINAIVYTYFHNIFILNSSSSSVFIRLKWKCKRLYIRLKRRNTDYWIVQTQHMVSELAYSFNESRNRILQYPFFNTGVFDSYNREENSSDYAYIANFVPEKNHTLLISAWKKLALKGIYPVLHLTLSCYPEELEKHLLTAKEAGARIINHGSCSLQEVASIYTKCKAIVYPSKNESFGLGIIEAMCVGCDVIGAALPYISSVCVPSTEFDLSVDSLVNAIINYEKGECPITCCKITNKVDELISLISEQK